MNFLKNLYVNFILKNFYISLKILNFIKEIHDLLYICQFILFNLKDLVKC